MTARDAETFTFYEVRWSCPTCGRFIAEAAIRSWDKLDPGAYYGISSTIEADCGRCGTVEPHCIQTREMKFDDHADGAA